MNEPDLDGLKAQYQSIPIPEELEGRVRAAIARSGGAQKENPAPKKAPRYFRNAFGGLAAAMLTLVVLANSGPGVARAMERIPVLGALVKVVTFRTYEDQTDVSQARVDVPRVEGGGEALSAAIEDYTNTIIEEYRQDAAAAAQYAADPGAPDALSGGYELDLRYDVATDNDALFSLRFDKSVVMASGMQSVKIYNVDKASGEILSLADLFRSGSDYLDVLTREIQRQMQERMDADESVSYWLHDEVAAWNFTALDPDAAFYVNADGLLTIVFNEGDVAPMYMGVTEFSIPADAVAQIALPGYLL